MNLIPDKQLFNCALMSHFNQPKIEKKHLCMDNKVQETIGDVYCPTCENEKCVYISINKSSSVYDCKKCKTWCHVSYIPFKDKKRTIMLSGGDGRSCFLDQTSLYYENEKPSPSLKNFFRQSQSTTPKPEPKKAKILPFTDNRVDFPLVDTDNQIIFPSLSF